MHWIREWHLSVRYETKLKLSDIGVHLFRSRSIVWNSNQNFLSIAFFLCWFVVQSFVGFLWKHMLKFFGSHSVMTVLSFCTLCSNKSTHKRHRFHISTYAQMKCIYGKNVISMSLQFNVVRLMLAIGNTVCVDWSHDIHNQQRHARRQYNECNVYYAFFFSHQINNINRNVVLVIFLLLCQCFCFQLFWFMYCISGIVI